MEIRKILWPTDLSGNAEKALPYVVFISSLTGTIIGGGSLLLARRGYRARIPFGPFLALGALIYFFFGADIIHWYYGLLR